METANDLVENDITLILTPGGEMWEQFLAKSPVPEYNKLAENVYIPTTWGHWWYYSSIYIVQNGTHALLSTHLTQQHFCWDKWYRSKEILRGNNPYAGYLTNKKWSLNEV